MKHFVRCTQTDNAPNEIPEMHEDKDNDIINEHMPSQAIEAIKTVLGNKMSAVNYKFQREISYMDEPFPRKKCYLEDL